MEKRAATPELVLEVRQLAAAGAAVFVISAAHREPDAVASGHYDRGRPNLDVELHHLARLQRLFAVVGVIGPIGCGELPVELAVRGPEPALGDRRVRIDG